MSLKLLQSLLRKKQIDVALLFNLPDSPDPNYTYFTHIPTVLGSVYIPKKGETHLYVNPLETSIARTYSSIKQITPTKEFITPLKHTKKRLTLGINGKTLPLVYANNLKRTFKCALVDISKELQQLRGIKTPQELTTIKKSCAIVDEIMENTISFMKRGQTEQVISAFVAHHMIDKGVTPSFPTIVASGKNSKNPHSAPSNNKLKGFTVLDMGVIYNNYCSDISRTVYIGRPTLKEKVMYHHLLDIQNNCCHQARPGIKTKDLHDIAARELGKHFTHGLGHGIGIQIHEAPTINASSTDVLREHMVITVEPGYYGAYGIRVEDCLIVKKKPINLTRCTKALIIKR